MPKARLDAVRYLVSSTKLCHATKIEKLKCVPREVQRREAATMAVATS